VKPTKKLSAFFSLVQKRVWILLSFYHSIYLSIFSMKRHGLFPLFTRRLWLLCTKECAQASSIDSHHIKNAVLVVYGVTRRFKFSRLATVCKTWRQQNRAKFLICNMETYIKGQSFVCMYIPIDRALSLHTNDDFGTIRKIRGVFVKR
jgi:hypothetical protein